jgi:hypothetical protein
MALHRASGGLGSLAPRPRSPLFGEAPPEPHPPRH